MLKYILVSFLVLIISSFYNYYFNKPSSVVEYPNTCYDYIVVGAGTAGCVVASRLSESGNATVLLIEAGNYFNWMSILPLMAPALQGSSMDWSYKTESQKFSSKGFRDYKQSWPRGKGLGGTGQMNYLVHSFGRAEDYETWPKGWTHTDLIPYFKKVIETMNVKDSIDEPLLTAFLESTSSISSKNVVFQKANYTIKKGRRWSTYHAYLQNAWNRKNLHVLINTFVTQILFNNTDTKGVKVLHKNGSFAEINVRKEVILCAGTINTAQLLLISGIGPARDLDTYQIPVVRDLLGIGKNLFDHFNVPIYVNLKKPVSVTLKRMLSIREVYKYLVYGTGLFATNRIIAMGRANNSGIILFAMASTAEILLKDIANFHTETFRAIFPAHSDSAHEGFLYLVNCLQPKSRGTVTLKSRSILDSPKIDPRYLNEHEDVESINLALQTLDTKLFHKFGAQVHLPDLDECRHLKQDYKSHNYSECVMKISGLTSYHPCGTCRMGMDKDAVVDEKLRVKGITGLRVIDASILPSPISGTPNSVIIAMAERGSDIILEQTFQ